MFRKTLPIGSSLFNKIRMIEGFAQSEITFSTNSVIICNDLKITKKIPKILYPSLIEILWDNSKTEMIARAQFAMR